MRRDLKFHGSEGSSSVERSGGATDLLRGRRRAARRRGRSSPIEFDRAPVPAPSCRGSRARAPVGSRRSVHRVSLGIPFTRLARRR